jgi:hypothetical protein
MAQAADYLGVGDSDGREVFRLSFLPKGARDPIAGNKPAAREVSGEEMALSLSAAKYWADVIVQRECPGGAQAACAPRVLFVADDDSPVSGRPRILPGISADHNLVLSQTLLAQGVPRAFNYDNPQDYAIAISVGEGPKLTLGAAAETPNGPESRDPSPGLYGSLVAAFARGLGLYAPGPQELRSVGRDTQFGQLIQKGQAVGEGWAFHGVAAGTVFGDGTFRPVPMGPQAGPADGAGEPADRGLFRLRNTLLSGDGFRNYQVPTEVELAALIDLGYDVDLSRAYGRSVYGDGTTVLNGSGFMSSLPHGVGLHVYGSFNTVTQEGDLSASGAGGVGVRIDGRGNSVIISGDCEVKGAGPGGVGILVAYGSGHSVTSLGPVMGGEDAARFDMGAGLPGIRDGGPQEAGAGPRGSFYRAGPDAAPYEREAQAMLDGPLVRVFTVGGLLQGQKRAFYAAPDSYVEVVSLIAGASVFGDLVSDYDDMGRGSDKATTIYAGGSLGAYDRPDPDFRLTLSGRVLGSGKRPGADGPGRHTGRGLIDLVLVGGTTCVPDSGRIEVRGFTVESGAVLEIRPDLANLRPVFLEADGVAFKEGSRIRVSESTSLAKGEAYYFVPLLKVTDKGGGFLNLAELELDPGSTLAGGELAWYSPGPGDFLLAYVTRGAGLTMAD